MNIRFLGTGGVFDEHLGNSAALARLGERLILIDCGPLTYGKLVKSGAIGQITDILITHLHGDHIGGLFQLILHMNGRLTPRRKATLLYPVESFRDHLSDFLKYWFPKPSELVEFSSIRDVDGVGAIDTTDRHIVGLPSFAYFFYEGDSLIYFSGDVGDVTIASKFLASRSEGDITVFHEMHHLKGSAHTHYSDIMANLSEYQVYGYHCNPDKLPDDNSVPLVAHTPSLMFTGKDDASLPG